MPATTQKKFLLITYGDANNASAWSNIPYLFKKTLESKEIEVHNLNINPNKKLQYYWNRYFFGLINRLYPGHQYAYIRTYLNKLLTSRKIKKFVTAHADADYCIFLNYDYYNKYTATPTLLFGDWTYDIVILERLQRKPYFFEKWFSGYQKKAIENAQVVVTLFKDCAQSMKETYSTPHIYHLGSNVINDLAYKTFEKEELLQLKKNSQQLLFIGTTKYLKGAQLLIDAVQLLQNKHPQLSLHIIGIEAKDLNIQAQNIYCYGYLKKDNVEQNKLYYDLLAQAKCLVNPSEVWAGYSSTIEAMYYYTPIVTTPYKAFVMDFGDQNDFGYFLHENNTPAVASAINSILEHPDYEQICINAHNKVADYTWSNYIEKLLKVMEDNK